MQNDILNNKDWFIKLISLIDRFNKILFYIIINKIIYNLMTKSYDILYYNIIII